MSAPTRLIVWGADDPTLEGLDELRLTDVVLVEAGREATDPSVIDQVLALADRMDDADAAWTLALGPDVFGWAATGQLSDLRGLCELRGITRVVVWAPATQDSEAHIRESFGLAIENARRLGAIAAVRTDLPRALEAFRAVVDGTWTGSRA